MREPRLTSRRSMRETSGRVGRGRSPKHAVGILCVDLVRSSPTSHGGRPFMRETPNGSVDRVSAGHGWSATTLPPLSTGLGSARSAGYARRGAPVLVRRSTPADHAGVSSVGRLCAGDDAPRSAVYAFLTRTDGRARLDGRGGRQSMREFTRSSPRPLRAAASRGQYMPGGHRGSRGTTASQHLGACTSCEHSCASAELPGSATYAWTTGASAGVLRREVGELCVDRACDAPEVGQ